MTIFHPLFGHSCERQINEHDLSTVVGKAKSDVLLGLTGDLAFYTHKDCKARRNRRGLGEGHLIFWFSRQSRSLFQESGDGRI